MMSVDFIIYIILLMMSCLIFSLMFFHVLKILMALEFIIISTLMLLIYYVNDYELSVLSVYYLIFVVCEAIIGLSMMVLMVRLHGNEYTKSIMMNKW